MIFISFLLLFGGIHENAFPRPSLENGQSIFFNTKAPSVLPKVTFSYEDSLLGIPLDLNSISYQKAKSEAEIMRLRLRNKLRQDSITMDEVKLQFTNHLVDKLIPHWYGTPWSYGGHTAVPGQGKIACGYFISTTLRDMGIKLNRYKLAQKAPIDEAKTISCGNNFHTVVAKDSKEAFEKIDTLTQEGLYFIGFDKGHVGYLLKRNGKLVLIHSNYLYPVEVCREALKDSRVFQSFDTFYLVDISHNNTLMRRWLSHGVVL